MKTEEEIKQLLLKTEETFDIWQKAQATIIEALKKGINIKNKSLFYDNMLKGLVLLDRAILLQNLLGYTDFNNKKVFEDYKKMFIDFLIKK